MPPVHILQIGDSHTAGDVTTAAWRDLLQARYGNGGRGVLPPGRPYAGYLTKGVTASMSPDWLVGATFGPGSVEWRPLLGLASFSLSTNAPGAEMALAADTPDMAFDRFVLCAGAGMFARSVTVRTADGDRQLDLNSAVAEPRCTTLKYAVPQMKAEVIADHGPVTLTSWGTFRDNGGVALSNVGIIGSQLQHFATTDDDVLAVEFKAYAPDLIVLAFGTNEGFGPRLDTGAYEAVLRGQIARLRALAPGVPLLLLGPPDALSRTPELRGDAPACPGTGTPPLFVPLALAQVRAVQRRVAGEMNIAWWDWQAAMGGPCSAARWAAAGLMRADKVHLLASGGAIVAARLQADLDRAMAEMH
ncbi:GDSL-type esterase/lipase family protein [Sphingomonas caeni]|uniref:GDSL-type esterase/lipase family protein n=1 Tax=Sphingomonas caeni TaxID=2984949 RepID=UPI00222E61BC|nr:GDSL-type esterase/lipase family protein [Sphingomonas caeni]